MDPTTSPPNEASTTQEQNTLLVVIREFQWRAPEIAFTWRLVFIAPVAGIQCCAVMARRFKSGGLAANSDRGAILEHLLGVRRELGELLDKVVYASSMRHNENLICAIRELRHQELIDREGLPVLSLLLLPTT